MTLSAVLRILSILLVFKIIVFCPKEMTTMFETAQYNKVKFIFFPFSIFILVLVSSKYFKSENKIFIIIFVGDDHFWFSSVFFRFGSVFSDLNSVWFF